MQTANKIYHFYHAYADGTDSIPVVQEHLYNLVSSNLSKYLEEFYIGIVGSEINRKNLKDMLSTFTKDLKFEIIFEEPLGYEQITLEKMHEYAKFNEGYYFYAHSKSSSKTNQSNKCWMKTMEFFNVLKWEQAIERLSSCDAVGCFWMTYEKYPKHEHWSHTNKDTNSFFAGNYWWTTSSVIKDLPKPDLTNRYMAEQWIGNKVDLIVHDSRVGIPKPKNYYCGKKVFSCICKKNRLLKKIRNISFYLAILITIYLSITKILSQ